MNDRQPVKG